MHKILLHASVIHDAFCEALASELSRLAERNPQLIGQIYYLSAIPANDQALKRAAADCNIYVVVADGSEAKEDLIFPQVETLIAVLKESPLESYPVCYYMGSLASIPSVFEPHITRFIAGERSAQYASGTILAMAGNFFSRRNDAARLIQEEQARQRIATNAPEFIDKARQDLMRFEHRNRYIGYICYLSGVIAFSYGLIVLFKPFEHFAVLGEPWVQFGYNVAKKILALALIVAGAKYAFVLGKSFTSEALKASDRLHAINFGKFFLEVYGEKSSWKEVKEAFADWNIDRRSSFGDLDAAAIDPQIMTVMVEAAKSISTLKKDAAEPASKK